MKEELSLLILSMKEQQNITIPAMIERAPVMIPPMQLCLWFLSIIAEAFSSRATSALLDKGQPQ